MNDQSHEPNHKTSNSLTFSFKQPLPVIVATFCFLCFALLPTKNGIINGCISLLTLIGIGIVIHHGKYKLRYQMYWKDAWQNPFLLLFLLLWLPLLISSLDAYAIKDSFKVTLGVLRYAFIFFAILTIYHSQQDTHSPKLYHQLTTALVLLVIFWSIDALIQWIIGFNLLGYPFDQGGISGTSRLSGIFAPKFHLGYAIATLSPLVFAWCFQYLWIQKKQRVLPCLIIFNLCIIVFLSGSRSGLLSLAVAIFFFLMHQVVHKKLRIKNLLLILMVFFLFCGFAMNLPSIKSRVQMTISPFTQELNHQNTQDHSLYQRLNYATAYRLTLWEASWNFFLNHPINGIGIDNFKKEYDKLPLEKRKDLKEGWHPHMHILEIATESGLIGLISYIIMYIMLIFITYKSTFAYEWLLCVLVAIFPFNMHVSIYSSFWLSFIFIPLSIGLCAQTYLRKHSQP